MFHNLDSDTLRVCPHSKTDITRATSQQEGQKYENALNATWPSRPLAWIIRFFEPKG